MIFARQAQARRAEAQRVHELEAQVAAMERSQAVIEFKLDGTILRANTNFLGALGYTSAEVEGRHHRMFVSAAEASSAEYADFWRQLNKGEYVARKFLRIAKGGGQVWIQASYNPVLNADGRPYKIIKFATDVTQVEVERAHAEAERQASAEEQSRVVATLADRLRRMSEGDLQAVIEIEFGGAYRQIRDDFNTAIDAMRETIGAIAASTGSLRNGSNEIASAADNLSRRTEQQAASLEETAAALDQITATVQRSAEGAKQASAAASGAKADAEQSGVVVREAVAAMGAIETSSGQISQIIGVIDEIAFQTNLLALNAGVEAARAGEAGRGFAVVASEVRALAQRSAEAAKEIKGLISSSSQHVERGVTLVGETGKSLEVIMSKVTEIDGLISEIALSAQEQATGLGQVNTAVNQMDQVTQQNAAMVEQTNAAASTMRIDSEELARLVGRFRVGAQVVSPPRQDARHQQARLGAAISARR
ncbi:methyl-accepting chemotaxis protein [Phenylobacterium sp.]|uniref:methyl-accepting chemotaxis protein n=1 Tax=Phenylobacterium sp. TaxID=1871053 RepID=UPI00286ACCF5|nr:methyl-accepting chemotaxis protein [Phenylobacterium sp.]